MLRIIVGDEGFNDETNEFVTVDPVVIELEHSLVSLSKWESKFEKPFLGREEKTKEETFEYLKMMVLTQDLPEGIFDKLSTENIQEIKEYIDSKQSATIFTEIGRGRGKEEIITSELIYYWMVAFTIPFACEEWHLNRLLTLIRICGIKNGKQKKMPKGQLAQQYREINERRRAEMGTRG
jgi:hypothetical protein